MLSSWNIWDFDRTLPEAINGNITAFLCLDPFILKIFENKFIRPFYNGEEVNVFFGDDVNQAWIENELESQDLFFDKKNILIKNAELISIPIFDSLVNAIDELKLEDKIFIIFNKSTKLFEKLSKKENIRANKINETPFWMYDKLLGFICEQMRLSLSYDVKNYLLEAVGNNSMELINALKVISLEINTNKSFVPNLENVKSLIKVSNLDQFMLARLIGKKDFAGFYKRLLDSEYTFDELRRLFNFLQSHLLKLADQSYLAKKKKHAKYDKEIIAHSKLWSGHDIEKYVTLFSELEIMAKSSDLFLTNELKNLYVNGLYQVG